jgi:hypothetical protein
MPSHHRNPILIRSAAGSLFAIGTWQGETLISFRGSAADNLLAQGEAVKLFVPCMAPALQNGSLNGKKIGFHNAHPALVPLVLPIQGVGTQGWRTQPKN